MADPLLAFRTITEAFLTIYEYVNGVLTPRPIALPLNPASFELNPGISLEQLTQTGCTGADQIVLEYEKSVFPEISMSFAASTPEIEALVINRIPRAGTNFDGFAYFDVVATATSITAKASGKYGNEVTLQSGATSKALCYYTDPLTRLAKPLTVVDTISGDDQIVIGANLALTLSTNLVTAGYYIYGWVPATFPSVTYMSSDPVLQIGVYAIGVCFDGAVKLFNARRCSFLAGGSITKDPKRDIKLRVLADSTAKTGNGYDIVQLRSRIAC